MGADLIINATSDGIGGDIPDDPVIAVHRAFIATDMFYQKTLFYHGVTARLKSVILLMVKIRWLSGSCAVLWRAAFCLIWEPVIKLLQQGYQRESLHPVSR